MTTRKRPTYQPNQSSIAEEKDFLQETTVLVEKPQPAQITSKVEPDKPEVKVPKIKPRPIEPQVVGHRRNVPRFS
jgi:hypothetical protein